jgi:hypothetical protein
VVRLAALQILGGLFAQTTLFQVARQARSCPRERIAETAAGASSSSGMSAPIKTEILLARQLALPRFLPEPVAR